MKIGLVTLHNFNYGSVLQCWATQEYLKENGCSTDVIEVVGSSSFFAKIRRVCRIISLIIQYPQNAVDVYKILKSQRGRNLTISHESVKAIGSFLSNRLNVKKFSSSVLYLQGYSENYDLFFSGSDQVWNGSQVENTEFFFLRFCSKEKRIAWSPSLGGKSIANYNKNKYKKYIYEFARVSCREKSGVTIIKKLCNIDAVHLFDPVILLSADEWRTLYLEKNDCKKKSDDYILVFFLNKPKEEVVEKIKQIAEYQRCGIVSFSYHYDVYKNLDNVEYENGAPEDFLCFIDGAKVVLTDSFHASLFSAILHTNFFTFDRNYTGGQNQGTRLEAFYQLINEPSRYNPSRFDSEPNYAYIDSVFEKEKNKFDQYFTSIRKYYKGGNVTESGFYGANKDCVGCGACAEICPVHAITMTYGNDGCYPKIDSSKCIRCKKCVTVCDKKNAGIGLTGSVQTFIGCGSRQDDINESASGGVFYEIAKQVIAANGIVYGAALVYDGNRILCKHIGAESLIELSMLRNSKYVQSSTIGIFSDVKKQLNSGRFVLFSGTSCQVASLYSFLGKRYYDNLLTIDLICHGAPSQKVFDDYISYLSKKYNGKITDFSFRSKDVSLGKTVPYIMSVTAEQESGNTVVHHIGLRESAYYRMFMACGGYREACYHCKFAGLHKLADITLGDYYIKEASDEVRSLGLNTQNLYSCVIVRSKNGNEWINKACVSLYPVSTDAAVQDHPALQHPSEKTDMGEKLYSMYKKDGFAKVQKYIDRKNRIVDFVKAVFLSIFFGKKRP